MSDLSPDTVRARWGAGQYRVCWFRTEPETGRLVSEGHGRMVLLDEERPQRVGLPAAVAAPVAAPGLEGLDGALRVMAIIQSQAANQMQQIVAIAGAMRGGGGDGGISSEVLRLMFDNQAKSTELLIERITRQHEESMSAMRAELAALRGELDDDDDGQGDDGDDASAGKPAAPLFRPGKPVGEALQAAALNWAAENPGQLVEALKQVPKVIDAVSRAMQQQAQAQQAQTQQPEAPPPHLRPRAMPANVTPIHRPKEDEPGELSGFNVVAAKKTDAPAVDGASPS